MPILYAVNLEMFARILFSRITFKNRHTCDVKILRIGHDLPISVIDRVISQCREDFIKPSDFSFLKHHTRE